MINKVMLLGNLGKDPEVRYLEQDVAVANFTLATSESYKDKNGNKVENTEWHNIVLWRGLAKIAEAYLKKGDTVYIEGKIKTRSYDDKDGNKRYITEIFADNLKMLPKGQKSQEGQPPYQEAKKQQEVVSETSSSMVNLTESPDDDLPF